MIKWYRNSSVIVKILISFFSVVFILALCWLIVTYTLMSKTGKYSEIRATANRINVQMLETRRQEKNFLIRDLTNPEFFETGSTKALQLHSKEVEKLQNEIKTLADLASDEKDRAFQMSELVAKYNEEFLEMVNAYRTLGFRDWGLEGQWRRLIREIEQTLEKEKDLSLQNLLLQVRRDEKNYLLTKDKTLINDINNSLKNLEMKINQSNISKKNSIVGNLKQYRAAFQKYMELQEKIGLTEETGLRKDIITAARALEPLIDKVLEDNILISKAVNKKAIWWTLLIIVVLIGVSGATAYFIGTGIIGPLKPLSAITEKASHGDLDFEVPPNKNNDEIGRMSKALSHLAVYIKEIARITQIVSEGNLTVEIKPETEKDVLKNALVNMVSRIKNQISGISETVHSLVTTTSELATTTSEFASSSAETSTSVSETTTSTEEVRQTAEMTSQKAHQALERAQSTKEVSDEGIRATRETIESMQKIKSQMEIITENVVKLSEQNQAIGEIIAAVDDITERSNLLAVNASIEAIKAGEQGKGFSVVAQEIRNLADQSKQSTKEIRAILGSIQKATSAAVLSTETGSKTVDAGVKKVTQTGEVIETLAESIEETAQLSTQIATSASEQQVGMQQITAAMENLKQAGLQNAEGSRQLEEAIADLKDMGKSLEGMVSLYKI